MHFTRPLKIFDSTSDSESEPESDSTKDDSKSLILMSLIQILMNPIVMNLLYPTINCWATLFHALRQTVAASYLTSELPLSITHFCVGSFLVFSVQENFISLFLTLMVHFIQKTFCLLRSFVN